MRRLLAVVALVAVTATCTRRFPPQYEPPILTVPTQPAQPDSARRPPSFPDVPGDSAPRPPVDGAADVRVALATAAQQVPLAGTGPWRLYDQRSSVLVRGRADDEWTIQSGGARLRAVGRNGTATAWADGFLTLRPDAASDFVRFAGRRFRGAIRIVPTDTGLMVINVLPVEEYLRGVVPLEIGQRPPQEQAAVEAQAIAARSYTWVRLGSLDPSVARNRFFDVVAGVGDQVYGGADAERDFSDQAVRATTRLVLHFGGRIVDAPYSSTCGGATASPDEVWRTSGAAYLRRVSDRIPGSADRYYCDIAPRFSWSRTYTSPELDATIRAYLRNYADVPASGPGRVTGVHVESRTPSGRVERLIVNTDRGTFPLRGNDIRYVLRSSAGETLNSTYFTVDSETGRDGSIVRLVLRGNGYGHGVGMCQWGAIGRARAGQSVRAILATYYPGTTVGPAN